MLFLEKLYHLQKFYTAAGSDGSDKYHLCTKSNTIMMTSEELKQNLHFPLNTDTILTIITRLTNYQHYNI